MTALPKILYAAEVVQQICEEYNWRFCFIGGLAVQRWGEPRFTQDVDLTLLTGFGQEEPFIDALLGRLHPRTLDAKAFALVNRVLLLKTSDNVPVDVALGALPFEEACITRATPWSWIPGKILLTCSAEDLVVHKVFAGRPLDWLDVERVLTRQHGRINLPQVREDLRPLLELKGTHEALAQLETVIAAVNDRLRKD
ncbi:MAG TPA: hypothetical protein VEH27_06740 [Methylomirabilota bacterium]|nr:hypothetical protein [Methylomirabilota bacterium]